MLWQTLQLSPATEGPGQTGGRSGRRSGLLTRRTRASWLIRVSSADGAGEAARAPWCAGGGAPGPQGRPGRSGTGVGLGVLCLSVCSWVVSLPREPIFPGGAAQLPWGVERRVVGCGCPPPTTCLLGTLLRKAWTLRARTPSLSAAYPAEASGASVESGCVHLAPQRASHPRGGCGSGAG